MISLTATMLAAGMLTVLLPTTTARTPQPPAPAAARDDGTDWMTYNRTLAGDRYSPLTQITRSNVARLKPIAVFDTGTNLNFQSGPVVVDGVLYVTTVYHTYAIDADTGKLKWKHVHRMAQPGGTGAHRGVAFADGKVFRGFNDGLVAGLDAATGKVLWTATIANPKVGESIPLAPIAWDGRVYIGNAGGDMFGVTGRVYALDANTGKEVWRFDTVPKTGPAAATWPRRDRIPPTGGATWTTYSLDVARGLLYVPAGNPAPDFVPEVRDGPALYTNCLVALDARTGALRAYYQPVKNDYHDWDVASAPALVTTKSGRRMALLAPKDGLLYGIDRGALASSRDPSRGMVARYRTPVTTRFNTEAKFNTRAFTRFAPGVEGGVEWNGPAYDPRLNTVFTPAIDWPHSVKLGPRDDLLNAKPGTPFTGTHDGGFGKKDPFSTARGWLTALDADNGRTRWKFRAPTPLVAGVTPTAGGVVFAADLKGRVFALDSRNGRMLWKHDGGYPVGGGIVSYAVNGRQRIAVAAGINSPSWGGKRPCRVVVYGLE